MPLCFVSNLWKQRAWSLKFRAIRPLLPQRLDITSQVTDAFRGDAFPAFRRYFLASSGGLKPVGVGTWAC
jgi:hypothetical protein